MASGRKHQTINIVVLVLIAALIGMGGYLWRERPEVDQWIREHEMTFTVLVVFALSFLIGTFLVTPDLDLAEQGVLAKRNWGGLGLIWVPYGLLFSHRGVSHGWFFGPLTRLIYLAGLAAVVAGLVGLGLWSVGWAPAGLEWRPRMGAAELLTVTAAVGGFYLSQWLHLLADGVGPLHGLRRLLGKLRGRT